jgi:hypothetical protein
VPPGQVLHGDVVGAVLCLAAVEDGDDERAGQGGGAPCLAPEALDEVLVLGVAVLEQLERDVAVEDPVVRQEHVGHAAAARQGPQLVPVVDEVLAHGSDYTAPQASLPGGRRDPQDVGW